MNNLISESSTSCGWQRESSIFPVVPFYGTKVVCIHMRSVSARRTSLQEFLLKSVLIINMDILLVQSNNICYRSYRRTCVELCYAKKCNIPGPSFNQYCRSRQLGSGGERPPPPWTAHPQLYTSCTAICECLFLFTVKPTYNVHCIRQPPH